MEKIFLAAIEANANKLKQRLISDAMIDFSKNHSKDTGMTQQNAIQLADKYTALFLSQELQFNLTKNFHNESQS